MPLISKSTRQPAADGAAAAGSAPAGAALAPITFEILSRHGYEGLLVVTLLAGLMQIALGALRVGRLVHAIPVPVVGGFLAAVGILVFNSQLPVLLGLSKEARLLSEMNLGHVSGIHVATVLVGVAVIVMMIGLPKLWRRLPAPLIGLAVAMAVVATSEVVAVAIILV